MPPEVEDAIASMAAVNNEFFYWMSIALMICSEESSPFIHSFAVPLSRENTSARFASSWPFNGWVALSRIDIQNGSRVRTTPVEPEKTPRRLRLTLLDDAYDRIPLPGERVRVGDEVVAKLGVIEAAHARLLRRRRRRHPP